MKMNDLGSDFSKSYLIYIEECLGTFYSKCPSGPHLPLCPVFSAGDTDIKNVNFHFIKVGSSDIAPSY